MLLALVAVGNEWWPLQREHRWERGGPSQPHCLHVSPCLSLGAVGALIGRAGFQERRRRRRGGREEEEEEAEGEGLGRCHAPRRDRRVSIQLHFRLPYLANNGPSLAEAGTSARSWQPCKWGQEVGSSERAVLQGRSERWERAGRPGHRLPNHLPLRAGSDRFARPLERGVGVGKGVVNRRGDAGLRVHVYGRRLRV